MYWISKEWVILLCRIWPTLVFLILQKIVFWFWRKSFSDFEENRFMIFSRFFPDFEENRFLIYDKIISDFFTILFRFLRKSFFDFGENRFLIFSWFLETRFIKLICIRKILKKSCVNRVILTRFKARFIPQYFGFGMLLNSKEISLKVSMWYQFIPR